MKLPIYFISDLHLNLNGKNYDLKKRNSLSNFFNHILQNGGTLFIVGDLFDYWFEYKYFIPKNYFDILTKISQLKSKGIEINFIPGNHDFWINDFAYEELFSNIYPDGAKIYIENKKFLILHGDGILKNDFRYRILKNIIRNKLFIFLFKLIHPDISYELAKFLSQKKHKNIKNDSIKKLKSELAIFAKKNLNNNIDFVLLGHYHLKDEINLESGKLILLGDWMKWKTYAFFDGKNMALKEWK